MSDGAICMGLAAFGLLTRFTMLNYPRQVVFECVVAWPVHTCPPFPLRNTTHL